MHTGWGPGGGTPPQKHLAQILLDFQLLCILHQNEQALTITQFSNGNVIVESRKFEVRMNKNSSDFNVFFVVCTITLYDRPDVDSWIRAWINSNNVKIYPNSFTVTINI